MPVLEDHKARQNTKKDRDKQPYPKFLLLRYVRNYLVEQPAYCMQLFNTATYVCDCVAQQPVYRSKIFQKKKNYKGL